MDIEAVAVFEAVDELNGSRQRTDISQSMRDLEHGLHEQYGLTGLSKASRYLWFNMVVAELKGILFQEGLIEFDKDVSIPAGNFGQGKI